MNWYQTLKYLRNSLKLTLREVETQSGISNSLLFQIESGKVKNPGAFTLYKITKIYGVTIDEIIEKGAPTCRSWDIERINGVWVYCDTKEPCWGTKDRRPCKRCGEPPTKEGYDSCLGKLPHVAAACCGHGVRKGWITTNKQLGIK